MCDPVIDEHFRRSLGERYTHLFATSSTPVATSLDPCSGGGVAGSRDGKLQASTVNVTGLSGESQLLIKPNQNQLVVPAPLLICISISLPKSAIIY